jgi:hypothetical protein
MKGQEKLIHWELEKLLQLNILDLHPNQNAFKKMKSKPNPWQ